MGREKSGFLWKQLGERDEREYVTAALVRTVNVANATYAKIKWSNFNSVGCRASRREIETSEKQLLVYVELMCTIVTVLSIHKAAQSDADNKSGFTFDYIKLLELNLQMRSSQNNVCTP